MERHQSVARRVQFGPPDMLETRKRQMLFVGAVGMLLILIVSVVVVTWQSYLAWGAFPSWSGNGPILYGGLVLGFIVVAGFVAWSWLRMKNADME
jgi:hypothetical protein